ncbi:MAG: hypothetical protein R3F53_10150 [Gammaproteobacteria bacterium]
MNQQIGSVKQELIRRRDELRDFFVYIAREAQSLSGNKVLAQERVIVDAAIREMADELVKIEQHLLELND